MELDVKSYNEQALRPVFISSLWRSSSQYFLEKFRHDSTYIYCEPFHEQLSILRQDSVPSEEEFHNLTLQLGHYSSKQYYFQEYLSLLKPDIDGVSFFDIKFTLSNYFNDTVEDEIEYLNFLINFSYKLNKQPILGFTRCLGRLENIIKKMEMEVLNLIILRNPWEQFCSFRRQYITYKNKYFLIQPLHIIGLCNDPFVDDWRIKLKIPKFSSDTPQNFNKNLQILIDDFDNFSENTLLEAFCLVHILSYARAMNTSKKQVVFINKILSDIEYKTKVEDMLHNIAKIKISLDDFNLQNREQVCPDFIQVFANTIEVIGTENYLQKDILNYYCELISLNFTNQ